MTYRSNCCNLDAKVESHYAIYLHSQKKDALHMQKKCKPNAMELAPIAECSLSSTKIQYFFE